MASEVDLLNDAILSLTDAGFERNAVLRHYPLQVIAASDPCRKIIYTTKLDWLIAITDGMKMVPPDVAIYYRFGPLVSYYRDLIRTTAAFLNAPVHYIGDLDPFDLATYATLTLVANGPSTCASYLGISDPWVNLCVSDLAGQHHKKFEAALVPMQDDERMGHERLRALSIDWNRLVGEKALSILDSGFKLELEGASNPRFYSASFVSKLLEFIFG